MSRDFESRRLYILFSIVRAEEILDGHDTVLLDSTSTWREESPGDHCYESATSNELENLYFVGHIALPTEH